MDLKESVFYDKVNDFQEEFYLMAEKLKIKILSFKYLGNLPNMDGLEPEEELMPLKKRRKTGAL